MRLARLIEGVPDGRFSGDPDLEIEDIAYDSRRVTPGSLFVSMPSLRHDAENRSEQYIQQAIASGASAIATQSSIELEGATVIQVPDARLALADLAATFFRHPSEHLRLFGVTGTDGKTTTTYLLEQILAGVGLCTGLIGTVETRVGGRREENAERMTTPESLDVQRLLRRMVDAGVTHVAMEVSSHALVLHRVRGCRFAACALTNITADHIEFHGSWEAYFEAKARLFTDLAAGQPAVLNGDDPSFERLVAMISGPVTSYRVTQEADICATDIQTEGSGSRCTVRAGSERAEMLVPLPGVFNVSNALAAVGLALTAGVTLEEAAAGVSRAQPPPGRMQRLDLGQPFEVLIDYAHTMHAFRSVLAALRDRAGAEQRVIAVFGAAGDRDRAKRPVLAEVARRYADFFIITNEDPFSEDADAIIAQIAGGAPVEERGNRFECEPDREQAIERAISMARPGDTVIVLGKGHEQSIVSQGRKAPWSDVAAARRAIEMRL